VENPLISEAAQRYNVAINILHGNIEYINDRALGHIIALVCAKTPESQPDVAHAIQFLQQHSFGVEMIDE
jgi:ABC-type metal ion transport system, ATPase component